MYTMQSLMIGDIIVASFIVAIAIPLLWTCPKLGLSKRWLYPLRTCMVLSLLIPFSLFRFTTPENASLTLLGWTQLNAIVIKVRITPIGGYALTMI